MFQKNLTPTPAEPLRFAGERAEYVRLLREKHNPPPIPDGEVISPEKESEEAPPKSLLQLLEAVSPEDSALIALIVFLLCDNSNNDVVLLGILLYILLSKEK